MKKIELAEVKEIVQRSTGLCNPQIIYHWSSDSYCCFKSNHHFNIDKNGKIFISCIHLDDILDHTRYRNKNTISICLLGCKNSYYMGERRFSLGDNPLTDIQINTAAALGAIIVTALKLPIDIKHVITSSEAAMNIDKYPEQKIKYGIGSQLEPVWDMDVLYNYSTLHSGGNILRKLIYESIYE